MERDFEHQVEAMNMEYEVHNAHVEGRPIDTDWAIKIAQGFSEGEDSALGRFADTGEIDKPELVAEMIGVLRRNDVDGVDHDLVDALVFYFFMCNTDAEGRRPAIPNWNLSQDRLFDS